MKLAAVFIVWHDYDLLTHAVRNIRPLVEGVIVIASTKSNYGEYSPIPEEFKNDELYVREPRFHIPMHSETDKRNYGLQIAREKGYTHFLILDSDEFYEAEPFLKQKQRFLVEHNLKGLVCSCQTYFKKPYLTIGLDTTLVPFIHELQPGIRHEFNKLYPFAWDKQQIRIDPTRSLSIHSGVQRTDLIMHHLSWCRKDYALKIRNSTARNNLEHSCIVTDLRHAKEGYFVEYYRKPLARATTDFGIPDYEYN